MQKLIDNLKIHYGYSDYEIALVKYTLISILSEFSKLIILGTFYYLTNNFLVFCFSLLLLILLRFNGGGLHCKHYFTCFILTFSISYASIVILPAYVAPPAIVIMITSTTCMITNYIIGPVASPFRPSPDSLLIKHCNNNSFLVIFFFIIFVSIFHTNQYFYPYIMVGYWTIILHTIQLLIAKFLRKEANTNEKTKSIQYE